MKTKFDFQRWFNVLVTLALVLLLIGQTVPTQERQVAMAIDFDGVDDRISFPSIPTLDTLANISICFWFTPDALLDMTAAYDFVVAKISSGTTGWHISAGDAPTIAKTDALVFTRVFSTSPGTWSSPSNSFVVGTRYFVCVTVGGLASDDPTIYINGASVAITENTSPSGTLSNDSGSVVEIGGSVLGNAHSLDGKIQDVRIYNRILSATEILDIYNSRCMNNNFNGLVFAPMLFGAAGLQAFDGVSLAAGNTIVDPFSGAVGVPAGSPVGRAENYLQVCGH